MRSFMKPGPGLALAQIDYGAQEVGIAAAHSRDPVLIKDYLSGDLPTVMTRHSQPDNTALQAVVLGRIRARGGLLARDLDIL
jgi:hypothetical protein